MGLFDRFKPKFSGAPSNANGPTKPALRFTNPRRPDGPHVVVFDAVQYQNGQAVLVLTLENLGSSDHGKEKFLLALEAIGQNEGVHCQILVTEADYAALDSVIESVQQTHRSALARMQFAIA